MSVEEMAAFLAGSELLPGLDAEDFFAVAGEMQGLRLAAGENLLTQGDLAHHAYVVVSGEVEVVFDREDGPQQLSTVGQGAVVGEIGLMAGDTRSATVRAVTDSEVVSLGADGFRRLLAEHPEQAEALATRATVRLRKAQLVQHFNDLFGIIEPDVIALIEELTEWVSVPAGQMLFAEGDEGDAAHLVATGRLGVFREDGTGSSIPIGQLGRGDIVGELSLIDGEPRSATVYAVRDTQLIRFTREAYEQLLDEFPRVGLAVAKMAMARQRQGAEVAASRGRSFVLVAATDGVDLEEFAELLVADLGPTSRSVSAADVDAMLGHEGAAQMGGGDVGSLRLDYTLEQLEARHDELVYLIDDTWTAWSRRALRWTDTVVLVADATRPPKQRDEELELWRLLASQKHPSVSLVLLHPPGTVCPRGTPAWLTGRDVATHHHVRRGDGDHMARLARSLAGRATSVVLGGGGARGFAHLGVLEVLRDLGVGVDMIAGTSIGSIMAIGRGLGWSHERTLSTALESFDKLLDYTVPTTSLLKGARITENLRTIIGDVDITDLWIPYYCVSTNISRASIRYHDRGDLVQAIRASISIPGVLPPVPIDGELFVDGGVLDNVPVEEMRHRNPTGSIIAVDVSPADGPVANEDYGLSISGIESTRARRRGGGPPSLISTMVRCSLVGSVGARERVVREGLADLYLDVDVSGGEMLDFSTGARMASDAADSSRESLTAWVDSSLQEEDRL
jgi:predicted acylesterase/phospholipase RssA/CRP-like cAMP-binding protein